MSDLMKRLDKKLEEMEACKQLYLWALKVHGSKALETYQARCRWDMACQSVAFFVKEYRSLLTEVITHGQVSI